MAPVIQRIAATSIPMAISDAHLSDEIRPMIQRIAEAGNPFVSDCYLRLRLSQSDVERFNALIDAFEALIRFTDAVLLVNRWKHDDDTFSKQLTRMPLTFGQWVKLLK